MPALKRVLDRCEIGDCWTFSGMTNNGYGYVNTGFDRKTKVVHLVVWEALVGPVPNGMNLDHLCRVRNCVNPDHLEVVTIKENVLRGYGAPAMNARKKFCNKGHPFVGDNLLHQRQGKNRRCRACKNVASKRYRAKRKGRAT